jgi:UDP-glucose 4-epimerase
MIMIENRRYLLLGGNGFVGSHISDMLLRQGAEVRILDRYPEQFRSANPSISYFIGDFSDPELLKSAIHGIDTVIHLQSSTVPSTSEHGSLFDIETNLIPTVRLLETMVENKCNTIVYFSSGGAVYGNPSIIPTPEDSPLCPISSYGVVKTVIESYIQYFERHGVRSLIIRPSNLYGIRQSKTGVLGLINTLLENALHDEETNIFGDGSVIKDYVYINDLIDFLEVALKLDTYGVFNIGSGQGVSVNEVIALVENAINKTLRLRHENARTFDVSKVILDISKAKSKIGWEPHTPLSTGISEVWKQKVT